MARQVASVNPQMLIWSRKTVKLTMDLAARKIGVKTAKLESWEKGATSPTVKQLYKIANIYKRPFAIFYFPDPPKHFKALKDFRRFPQDYMPLEGEEYIIQKELKLFQQKRQIALELYDQLDIKAPDFNLKATIKQSPKKTATQIIQYLGINHNEISEVKPGYHALKYWKNKLESKGVLVFQTTGVPLNTMRGACIAESNQPVIIINSNDSANGRIFSMFHELVHIVLREDGISNFRFRNRSLYDQVEVYCNQTAAEVLVPSEALEESLVVKSHHINEPTWNEEELRNLSTRFCVSQEVILRRLLTEGKTTNLVYDDFRKTRGQVQKKSSGGEYYRNNIAKNGNLFLNLVLQGYYQEKLTASTFWDYTQIKVSNLAKLEELLYAKV